MNINIANNNNYHDLASLEQMRHDAKASGEETLEAVAKQLEGVFMNMVLKSMREANKSFQSDLFSSSSTDFYNEMHDQQLTLTLSQNGGMGLSEMLVKQLSSTPAVQPKSVDNTDKISIYQESQNTVGEL